MKEIYHKIFGSASDAFIIFVIVFSRSLLAGVVCDMCIIYRPIEREPVKVFGVTKGIICLINSKIVNNS